MTEDRIKISTDLVVDVAPGTVLNNNFSEFNTYWRGIMKAADIKPQTGDDVANIKKFEKQSDAVEKKVDDALRLAMTGNPEIQKLVSELEELKEDSRGLRLKLGKMAASWLTNEKQSAVQKQVERVAAESGILFTGKITKVGKTFCEIVPRLEKAGKGKRTLDTYGEAVSKEADLIISEMEVLSNQCNDNLIVIDAIGLPTLFPDLDALILLPPEQLAAITAQRMAEYNLQEEKKKAQIKRNPDKLAELKKEVGAINNVIHLENWWNKHEDEIKEALPHSEDMAELLKCCGGRKAELNIKLQENRNEPPPPMHEDRHPESGPTHSQPEMVRQEDTTDREEHTETKEDLSFTFKVTIPGNSQAEEDKANKLAVDIWELIGSRGCIAEEVKV